ncbi:MAG: glyoxalase [Candidatus Saccharibacteria bacterium]|nr:glyoxalase [Candidatus Saccharibacteria bacterium]
MINALSTFSGFSVDDIEKAKEFYVGTLELALKDDSMGLQLELPGGGKLFIYEKPGHKPAEFTVLNFVVENIDETVDHLAGDHGITFERYPDMPGPQDEKGIMRGKAANQGPDIAWFKDPAGNILSVIED